MLELLHGINVAMISEVILVINAGIVTGIIAGVTAWNCCWNYWCNDISGFILVIYARIIAWYNWVELLLELLLGIIGAMIYQELLL